MYKDAVTLTISAKCSDSFTALLKNKEGETMAEYDGYVPKFMPGEHFGDYVELDIDIETGTIKNWKKPTQTQLKATFSGEEG